MHSQTKTKINITHSGVEFQEEEYTSNAEEADTRVWLHAKHAKGSKKLILDVYHIGLTQVDFSSCEVIVILSSLGRELKLLHMNKLVDALECDGDLDSVPKHTVRDIICCDWLRLHLLLLRT